MPSNDYPPTIGEQITRFRRRADLTVGGLASKIRRSPNTIVNWEKDRTVPSYPDVLALADALEVDPETIDPDIRNKCSDDVPAAGR